MPQLRVFENDRGRSVFLSLQMLKRHHRLIIDRSGHRFLGFVRPRSAVPGDVEIVVPDPGWPGARAGESSRVSPEELARFEVRMADSDQEVWEHVRPLLDQLVP